MNEENDIEKYFNKETTSDQKDVLKKKILEEKDPDKALLLEVGNTIKEKSEVEDLEQRLAMIAKSKRAENKSSYKGITRIAAAISFLVVCSLGLYYFFGQQSSEEVFNRYYKPYDGVVVKRGHNHIPMKALEYYEASEYEKALDEFKISQSDSSSQVVYLLIASCYLSLGDAEEALKSLESLADTVPQAIEESRNWYTSLALLKLEKYSEAKVLLKNIEGSDSPYKKQASLLLKEEMFIGP
ncbi:MAG: hypothetical protein AAFN93_06060 [Bacteroidota bacterium]